MLLDGNSFRQQIEENLPISERFICYSAFFTRPAADWLRARRVFLGTDRLLVRGLPSDFLSGACSFSAIRAVLSCGLNVKMSSALHAKIYAFDDSVFSGSANLTAKGLALCYNHNHELGAKSTISGGDLSLLDNLWIQGVDIDNVTLEIMEKYIEALNVNFNHELDQQLTWPTDIVIEKRDLYCSDFPQEYPSTDVRWTNYSSFRQTAAYLWLLSVVNEARNPSFGFLTRRLHSAVYDDPTPYRQDIKGLLANLLSVLSDLDLYTLEVVKPNFRQVVQRRA